MARTPTPWQFDRIGRGQFSKTGIAGPGGRYICGTGGHFDNREEDNGTGENEANAAFIVLAVNSHDALVEALKSMCGAFDTPVARRQIDTDFANEARTAARAALALATPVTEPVEG